MIEILLNHSDLDVNVRDSRGASALHFACYSNSLTLVRSLLELGACVNFQDREGVTCLMETGRADIVRVLIDASADIELQDNSGNTVREVFSENPEILQIFEAETSHLAQE